MNADTAPGPAPAPGPEPGPGPGPGGTPNDPRPAHAERPKQITADDQPGTVVAFAGGGTGGHLYPALAVAEALAERIPGLRCRFLCSTRAIDARVLDAALGQPAGGEARPFDGDRLAIDAAPLALRPGALLRFARAWGPAVRRAKAVLGGFDPALPGPAEAVVSTGGFVAAPVARAARSLGIPVLLLNLDAVPGKANRLISRWATLCLSAVDTPRVPAGWPRCPPIVRHAAAARRDVGESRIALGLEPTRPTLLVTGGSQGAESLNRFVHAFVDRHPDALAGWQVLHQCGASPETETTLRSAYNAAGVRALVATFIDDMGAAWASADLCVARAGAGTVAEAWATATPTLFLPYPHHRDEHQRLNAEVLLERAPGGAIVARDHADAAKTLEDVGPMLRDVLGDEQQRRRMRAALDDAGPPTGAAAAADAALSLIDRQPDRAAAARER